MQWLKPCCVDDKTVILLRAFLCCLWLSMKADVYSEEQPEPWTRLPQRAPEANPSLISSGSDLEWSSRASGPKGPKGGMLAMVGGEQKSAAMKEIRTSQTSQAELLR